MRAEKESQSMRKIMIGGVVLGALVFVGCNDSSSGGSAATSPSASGAGAVQSATPGASGSASPAASGSAKAETDKEKKEKKGEGPKDHASRAKAMEEAWAAHDPKKIGALYAEDAVLKRPGRPEVKGREAIEKRIAENFAAFKDITVVTGRVWEKDKHTAVFEWLDKGTDTGEWPEIGITKATNKPFGVIGASWVEVNDDGLIKEEHIFLDHPTLIGQIQDDKKKDHVRPVAAAVPDGNAHFEPAALKEKEAKDDKEKAELAKASDVEKKNMEAEEKFVGAMNANKTDDALKLLTDDFKLVDYTQEKDVVGKKAFKDMLHVWTTAFPDLKTKSTGAFAEGDFVIQEFEYAGIQKGPLGPIKATNKPVTVHQLEVDQFKDGKFVKAWSFGNAGELMSEIVADEKKDEKEKKK
jgi:ketosteroid isomerase-like protein